MALKIQMDKRIHSLPDCHLHLCIRKRTGGLIKNTPHSHITEYIECYNPFETIWRQQSWALWCAHYIPWRMSTVKREHLSTNTFVWCWVFSSLGTKTGICTEEEIFLQSLLGLRRPSSALGKKLPGASRYGKNK